jgi:FtsP/CotA-like multicopper oxidase with cupredoxin domain
MAERPVRQSRLRLGPGERAELLVDMQTDQAIRSVSYPDSVTGRKMGPSMMMGGGGGMDGSMLINGRSMDNNHIDEQVLLGSIGIWEIRNSTPLTHLFHIHNVQFRVLDHGGNPPLPHE